MDTITLVFAVMTLCLAGVAFHAWRLGNEKRDIVLIGVCCALMGAGPAVTVIV